MTILWNNILVFFSVQLLVNNKIISLDLPVAEVYKKVWCTTNEVRARFLACGVGWLPDVVAVTWLACSSTEGPKLPGHVSVGKAAALSSSWGRRLGKGEELQEGASSPGFAAGRPAE